MLKWHRGTGPSVHSWMGGAGGAEQGQPGPNAAAPTRGPEPSLPSSQPHKAMQRGEDAIAVPLQAVGVSLAFFLQSQEIKCNVATCLPTAAPELRPGQGCGQPGAARASPRSPRAARQGGDAAFRCPPRLWLTKATATLCVPSWRTRPVAAQCRSGSTRPLPAPAPSTPVPVIASGRKGQAFSCGGHEPALLSPSPSILPSFQVLERKQTNQPSTD